MRVETLINHRTQEKEIRLSGELVMTREAWEQRGGVYHGSLGNAAKDSWYTVRSCERMGLPVTDEELKNCKDFAMFKMCYAENYVIVDGKQRVPCLPVFYRDKKDVQVKLKKRIELLYDSGATRYTGWSDDFIITTLEKAQELMKNMPDQYKIAGYVKK